MYKYRGYYIKDIVDEPEWQQLRESLVGTWTKTPTRNMMLLDKYLGDYKDWRRLVIVKNYLTGSAFRAGYVDKGSYEPMLEKVNRNILEAEQKPNYDKDVRQYRRNE